MNIDERPRMFVPRKLARYVADIVHRARCLICLSADYHKKFYFKGWSRYIILLGLFFPTNRIKPSNCTSYTCSICCSWKFPFSQVQRSCIDTFEVESDYRFYLPGINNWFLETRIFKGIKKNWKSRKKTGWMCHLSPDMLDVPLLLPWNVKPSVKVHRELFRTWKPRWIIWGAGHWDWP